MFATVHGLGLFFNDMLLDVCLWICRSLFSVACEFTYVVQFVDSPSPSSLAARFIVRLVKSRLDQMFTCHFSRNPSKEVHHRLYSRCT